MRRCPDPAGKWKFLRIYSTVLRAPDFRFRCAAISIAIGLLVFAPPPGLAGGAPALPAGVAEISGLLADETHYLIRVPPDWNGTVIGDLDYRTRADQVFYRTLLQQGFALVGTSRREDRFVSLSQRRDAERVQETLQIFRARFGRPKFTIVYGRSAGGGTALATAEGFADTTDGVIANCATTPLLSGNHRFELLYLLKALLGPDDPTLIAHPIPDDFAPTIARWEEVVAQARLTPAGRARIVMAFTTVQFPGFGHTGVEVGTPPPLDPSDPRQVVDAMMASVVPLLAGTVRNLRQLNINPAPMVWNTGVDYRSYFDNGDPLHKDIVRSLYREADLSLEDELQRLESSARVAVDSDGVAAWVGDPMQTPRGEPRIPVFHMHTTGDQSIAQEQSQVYIEQVRRNGRADLLRTATVHRGGHCTFTVGEELAALHVMLRRLETGKFDDTRPDALNKLASGLGTGSDPAAFVQRELRPFNGAWRMSVPVGTPFDR